MNSNESVVIILVESDDEQAAQTERNIRSASLTNSFFRFKNGKETLKFFQGEDAFGDTRQPPATILLLDLDISDIGGVEMLNELRASPNTKTLPIIGLTTNENPNQLDRYYQLDCRVYITKPVQADAFVDAIKRTGFFLEIVKLRKT